MRDVKLNCIYLQRYIVTLHAFLVSFVFVKTLQAAAQCKSMNECFEVK